MSQDAQEIPPIGNEDPEPEINPEPELFFADLRPLSNEEVSAQLESLQAQYSAVQARSDLRAKMDSARLQGEITHYRHETTRRKPASERVQILKGGLINK